MRKLPAGLLLIIAGFCHLPLHAAEHYSVMGVVQTFVDWDCAGFFCEETTPAVAMIGFGRPVNEHGLFLEGDAFMTISKGDVNSLDGSGSYSVNGLGAYGGWRSNGSVAGIGVGFGRHLMFELRVLNDRVNSLNASWRF